jgi:stage V sporulation protein D (sporulation-specific penicillin-binding protein)
MKFKNRKLRKKPGMDYNNRINVVIAIIFLLGLAVVYRLYYLQVANHDLYIALASSQHQVLNKLEPERGKIFIQDRGDGEERDLYPIATNKEFAHIFAVPKDIENPEEAADKIYEILFREDVEKEVEEMLNDEKRDEIINELDSLVGLSEEEILSKKVELENNQKSLLSDEEYAEFLNIKREANISLKKNEIVDEFKNKFSKKNDPYEPIKDKVDEEGLGKVLEQNIPGISYLMQKHRYYPEDFSSHISGFYGYSSDEKKGLYGLEGFFDVELSGKAGLIKAERDAQGNVIIVNDMEYDKEQNGSDLVLTIDRTIQFTACTKLKESAERHGADAGSVIVMRPQTGEIVAMCSYPDYDPNNYREAENSEVYNNQAIFGQYEPGSVFKTITMAAGLDTGAITPKTIYEDKGSIMIEGWPKPIKNSDFSTHGAWGWADMSSVLENSLNTGVIFAMEKTGDKIFTQYVKDFGFGEKEGIELETEAPGDISNLLRKTIRPVDSAVASFGQGITATPLQLINSYAAIANGGKLMKPYLVAEMIDSNGTKSVTQARELKRVISEKTALILSGMLVNVVDGGHAKLAAVDGYYVAGKTGTAQVADDVTKGYGEKTIHTFVGFSPVEEPEFVMLVRLDDPKDVYYSASSAAPLFGDIAEFILNYWKIPKERLR